MPGAMRDTFFTDVVAKNRYRVFGRNEECTPVRPGYEERFLQ